MKHLALLLPFIAVTFLEAEDHPLPDTATLVFEDNFDRPDPSTETDSLTKGWTANSKWRADNQKQAFLIDGSLKVITAEGAGHDAVLFQSWEPPLKDGALQFRLRAVEGDSFQIEFNDPDEKSVHSGHLAVLKYSDKGFALVDSKTGVMNQEIREKRKADPKDPEIAELLKTKVKQIPFETDETDWHDIILTSVGDVMTLYVDGKKLDDFQSAGFAHPTKQKINLTAKHSPDLDDLKIWSFDS